MERGPAPEAATIRRPDPTDLAALGGFFAGLSMRTRVQRFFAPVRPTPAMIRLACGWAGQAGRDHGESRAGGTDALVATLGGVIVGHAMAVDRPADPSGGRTEPPEGRVTEIGVVVADAWRGQGVGSALVRADQPGPGTRRDVAQHGPPAHPPAGPGRDRQSLDRVAHPPGHGLRDIQTPLPPEPRTVPPAAPPARRLVTSA